MKLHAQDGTLSDVDKSRVFVPRYSGYGGNGYAGANSQMNLLSDFTINISGPQTIGIYLRGVKGATNSNQYWRVYFNHTNPHDVQLNAGSAGSDIEAFFAQTVTGSGNLEISIYALDYSTGGLDNYVINTVQFSYY